MTIPRLRVRTLMVLVLLAAVILVLIPIVHRVLYPDTVSRNDFYIGDTLIFSVEF